VLRSKFIICSLMLVLSAVACFLAVVCNNWEVFLFSLFIFAAGLALSQEDKKDGV